MSKPRWPDGDLVSYDVQRGSSRERSGSDGVDDNVQQYGGGRFRKDDRIKKATLQNTVKATQRVFVGTVPIRVNLFVSPRTMNAHELSVVENEFHDDRSRLHLLFATRYRGDLPPYLPHDRFIPRGVDGLEGHTGSPRQVEFLEETGFVPYGAVVLDGSISGFAETEAILLHELGHALSIGWRDDQGAKIGECYSGQDCVFLFGRDRTPEIVGIRSPRWSIMSRRGRRLMAGRFAFSIEEISTVDLEDIPSKDD